MPYFSTLLHCVLPVPRCLRGIWKEVPYPLHISWRSRSHRSSAASYSGTPVLPGGSVVVRSGSAAGNVTLILGWKTLRGNGNPLCYPACEIPGQAWSALGLQKLTRLSIYCGLNSDSAPTACYFSGEQAWVLVTHSR